MEIAETLITVDTFSKICRSCLRMGKLKPLVNSKFTTLFKNLTNIKIHKDDKLPKNICSHCINTFQNCSAFIDTCKKNDKYLRYIISNENEKSLDDIYGNGSWDSTGSLLLAEDCIGLKEIKNDDGKQEMKNQNSTITTEKPKRGRPSKEHLEEANKMSFKKRIEVSSCNVCGKRFSRRGGLKRHSKIHLGIKPFECNICGKMFVEKATLNRHCLIHTGEKPFECNLCGKSASRRDQIIEHISKHHPNAINCQYVITEHKKSVIFKGDRINKKKFNIMLPIPEEEENKTKTDDRLDENNSTSCLETKALFNSDDINRTNGICNSEVEKFKTKKRIEICLCNLCGKVFRRRGYLKNHMAIHAKVKPYECKICGKGFTQKHALKRHNLVHTKERPYQCNLCGKTFTRKEILTEHINNHKEGVKPLLLCFHCGKCFSNKDYLNKHLKYYLLGKGKKKQNADEKKCVCPRCGKLLHSSSYLKTHLLTHTGEKPFQCNVCGNKFTVRRSLDHHLNIHKGIKPYQCNQCEKAFRTSGSLRKHTLLHSGERPFKCSSCDKGFIRRSHLKRHLRTH